MRADADHLARVRDPTVEQLLSHTATLTDARGPVRRHGAQLAAGLRDAVPVVGTGDGV